ncbi:MAG: MraY family glycosyltransferase [Phycisphaerales bacterium]|nr:MraY family glycosyltransferase [Phycisphaerales bacterium]
MMLLGASNPQYPPRGDFSVVEPEMFESDGIWVSIQDAWQVLVGVDRSGGFPVNVPNWTDLLNAFLPILLVAFLVTLFTVPFVRWLAVKFDIVDHPDGGRKAHAYPVAYLGGMAVFVGLLGGIFASYVLPSVVSSGGKNIVTEYSLVPFAITAGMFTIFVTGLFDDIFHWDPRLKIAGQLAAAAFLALSEIGTAATRGLISPILNHWSIPNSNVWFLSDGREISIWKWIDLSPAGVESWMGWVPWYSVDGIYYWAGVLFIAVLILGACNAANLIDGLDGLLAGSVGIMAAGFVVIAVMLAIVDRQEIEPQVPTDAAIAAVSGSEADIDIDEQANLVTLLLEEPENRFGESKIWAFVDARRGADPTGDEVGVALDLNGDSQFDARDSELLGTVLEAGIGPRPDRLVGSRLVLSLALLGAVLGFLPFNFNPAVIFLGDAGSLLLGYVCAVLILSLGEEGQTHYVIAGLIIFALPIMDTVLAILRRKLAGVPMSVADRNHIHHILLRSFGSVKKAVLVLYAINVVFVLLGVGLAAAVAFGSARYLLVYGVATIFFGLVGAAALKAGLRHRWMMQTMEARGRDSVEGASKVPDDRKPRRDVG